MRFVTARCLPLNQYTKYSRTSLTLFLQSTDCFDTLWLCHLSTRPSRSTMLLHRNRDSWAAQCFVLPTLLGGGACIPAEAPCLNDHLGSQRLRRWRSDQAQEDVIDTSSRILRSWVIVRTVSGVRANRMVSFPVILGFVVQVREVNIARGG